VVTISKVGLSGPCSGVRQVLRTIVAISAIRVEKLCTGGSISLGSATVKSGSTYTFTVTPNQGYYISSIYGCSGTQFAGNSANTTARSYTTGAVTGNCQDFCVIRHGATLTPVQPHRG